MDEILEELDKTHTKVKACRKDLLSKIDSVLGEVKKAKHEI
jgi:hypothetical protein